MSAAEILKRIQSTPPGEDLDWRSIREDIHEAKKQAATTEEHVALLEIFAAVMDLVERNITDETAKRDFQGVRLGDYRLLLTYETLVGENVSGSLLDAVTEREVLAGRMKPDDDLRELGLIGGTFKIDPPEVAAVPERGARQGGLRRALDWMRGRSK